jgi:3-oxoacyl-[acyl-carrier-protein] synthase-1
MNAIVRIVGAGAVTAVGVGVRQTDAALRANIGGFRLRGSAGGEATVMALLPDDALEPGLAAARPLLRTPWQARLIALATAALAEAAPSARDPVVVMLGLPDRREVSDVPTPPEIWASLHRTTGLAIDEQRSGVFMFGRAAMFAAYRAAEAACRQDPGRTIVCGAVDSYADPDRVAREEQHRRTIGGESPTDGRALGEAAGFLVLQAAQQRRRDSVEVLGAAIVDDPGHRFGNEPARGEGVADAIEQLRVQVGATRPFAGVWAGMTGESHDGKLWGVATLRHRDLIDAHTRLEHPADRIGDAGAGLGALLFVGAHARLARARRPGPVLLWAASDHGPCGCAAMRNEADFGA